MPSTSSSVEFKPQFKMLISADIKVEYSDPLKPDVTLEKSFQMKGKGV